MHNFGHNFKIVAIPDFTSTGNTDASDIGFSLVLPTGEIDIINESSLLSGRIWTVQQFDANFLTGEGLGDGTKDIFLFNNPPGQSFISHNAGDLIDLISFEVSNMPLTDEMYFLLNTDPIAIGAVSVLDSFYNSNIDSTTTQDYFTGIAIGLGNFMFSTLSIEDLEILATEIILYPNPAKDNVQISVPNNKEIFNIELFDTLGKQVFVKTNNNKFNVSHLPSGVYLVTIHFKKSKINKKLVVH
ncbi:T9SS type A sorting domain-containing protein [Lacinutrix himadriensis]|uniref:T9SS type A sorting domain-containing protein n=1 Tax=Lacinutrix himadriensis TaxID=641549 RepID=UPI0006E39158|nr:T9SS type A sorting domain-containing protein [Lacinutrix himadriensis]